MHVHRLFSAARQTPIAREPAAKAPPCPAASKQPLADAAEALRPWLAGKVVDAFEYRAAQKLGVLPPAGTSATTVVGAVGLWAAARGRKTLQLALHVPPPEAEFLA